MQRKKLRKSDIRQLNEELSGYGLEYSKKDSVEVLSTEDGDFISVNGSVDLFYHESKAVPTLKLLLKNICLKKVTVDMGAVKFVTSGADIMRPGITGVDSGAVKGETVAIVDENNGRPLAVGVMMFDAAELLSMDSGKVVKNIHFVGDDIWDMEI